MWTILLNTTVKTVSKKLKPFSQNNFSLFCTTYDNKVSLTDPPPMPMSTLIRLNPAIIKLKFSSFGYDFIQ